MSAELFTAHELMILLGSLLAAELNTDHDLIILRRCSGSGAKYKKNKNRVVISPPPGFSGNTIKAVY